MNIDETTFGLNGLPISAVQKRLPQNTSNLREIVLAEKMLIAHVTKDGLVSGIERRKEMCQHALNFAKTFYEQVDNLSR